MLKVCEQVKSQPGEVLNGCLIGFKRGTLNGPLCEEELAGVCILIKKIELVTDDEVLQREDTFGAFSGQVISIVNEVAKRAMLNA